MTPIIRPGKSELVTDVMGGGFPDMYQARISAGPRIIATPQLTRPLCHSFIAMPLCSIRCPWIVL